MRAYQFVTETINPDILNKNFKHTQEIGKYTYTATVEIFLSEPLLDIKAYHGSKQIGQAMFELFDWDEDPADGHLESGGTEVNPKYRNKGVASTMYAYARMLGNTIKPSDYQYPPGRKMWQAWKRSGDDKHLMKEEINPDILNPNFKHTQEIGDYTYTAETVMSMNELVLIITAYDGTKRIGHVKLEIFDQGHLESYGTLVIPEYRNKGIASTMYAYAKMLGNDIRPSEDQSDFGRSMWKAWKRSGDAKHLIGEEVLDEMPLPSDWDPAQYQKGTTFKSRLAYALERAKKLGTGSSRVATIIEYQGRPTVLKIAKNQKGLAQNGVEADILSDNYAKQMGILIPIIDYDTHNRTEPTWIHTELAQKVSEQKLCAVIKCFNLQQLINLAWAITGKIKHMGTYQSYVDYWRRNGKSEEDINTLSEYANALAELNTSYDVELGDFARAANWGMYQGKPVVIDVGFNSNVKSQYYTR